MAAIPEWIRVFVVMCAWALACNVMLGLLPRHPPMLVILPFSGFCLLGFVWLVPAVTVGTSVANYFVKLTLGIWAVTGSLAGLLVLVLS